MADLGSAAATRLAAPDGFRMIDPHHHLWDLQRLRYPWLTEAINPVFLLGDYAAFRRDYLPDDYLSERHRQNVVMSVHVEAECDRRQEVAETGWLSDMAHRFACPNAIVAHADLGRPDLEETLARHMNSPLFRGIRCKPRTAPDAASRESVRGEPGSMDDPAWRGGLRVLDRLGLVYDLRIPFFHLEEGAALAGDHPSLVVVLNHAGLPLDRSPEGWATWRSGMAAIACQENVSVKISCLGLPNERLRLEDQRRITLATIDAFGPKRCMFASNFPVDRLSGSFDDIISGYRRTVAGFTPEERDAMFYGNALRTYRPVVDPGGVRSAGTS